MGRLNHDGTSVAVRKSFPKYFSSSNNAKFIFVFCFSDMVKRCSHLFPLSVCLFFFSLALIQLFSTFNCLTFLAAFLHLLSVGATFLRAPQKARYETTFFLKLSVLTFSFIVFFVFHTLLTWFSFSVGITSYCFFFCMLDYLPADYRRDFLQQWSR